MELPVLKSSTANSSLENEYDYEDENDTDAHARYSSRIAAVVVYCIVILVALSGVLIKYFVTQYETLQAKAQMGKVVPHVVKIQYLTLHDILLSEYQQLQNMRNQ